MKLFARSALPIEPSQAWVGRVLALATALTLLGPWAIVQVTPTAGHVVSGLRVLEGALTRSVVAVHQTLGGRVGGDAFETVTYLLVTRAAAFAILFFLAGSVVSFLAPRGRLPRLPLLGAIVAACGITAHLVALLVWQIGAEVRQMTGASALTVIFVGTLVGYAPLLAALVSAFGLLEWRSWALWVGGLPILAGLAAALLVGSWIDWGARLAMLLAALALAWEARTWDELMADADDPELANRRAGLFVRAASK